MIDNQEITFFIANTIINDVNIDSFVTTTYGKSVMVFVGVDVQNPPEILDLPCVIIEPTVKNIGSSDSAFDYEIVLHIGVKGEDKPTINGNLITYEGVYDVERLGNLVVEALRTAIASSTNLDAYSIDFYIDEIANFPTYSGVVLFSMSVPNVIGTDKILFN